MAYEFTKDFINPEALRQSTHWFDRQGNEYLITEMSPYHARGALNKLWGAFGEKAVYTALYRALQRQMRLG